MNFLVWIFLVKKCKSVMMQWITWKNEDNNKLKFSCWRIFAKKLSREKNGVEILGVCTEHLDCLINRKGQCIRAVTPLSWVPWVPVNPSIFERKTTCIMYLLSSGNSAELTYLYRDWFKKIRTRSKIDC